LKLLGETVNKKLSLSRFMFYSNSIKQTIHIFAIAKVLNYLKVNREVQVLLPLRSYFATTTQQIPLI